MSAGKFLRIGITLPPQPKTTKGASHDQALWSSGLTQNAAFLARTLEKIDGVKVFAVNNYPLAKHLGIEYTDKGPGYLQVIIEVCTKLGPIEARTFRHHGGLLVHHGSGNVLAMCMEHVSGGFESQADVPHNEYDTVWLLPHIYQMNSSYFQLVYGCQVDKVPLIWAPDFLPKDWGYKPGDEDPRKGEVVTFEPSVSVVKTPHIPILGAEVAYRHGLSVGKPMFDRLTVFAHDQKYAQSQAFRSFLGTLDVADVLSCEPRVPIGQIVKHHNVRAVIAFQWWNELNYNWNELLYGGFPLIHNSQMMEAGYRYNGFEVKEAGDVLYQALEQHDEILPQYRLVANRFLAQLHPDTVRPMYEKLLQALVARAGQQRIGK